MINVFGVGRKFGSNQIQVGHRMTQMKQTDEIIRIILLHYPKVQAVYMFGTYGTADEWPSSDIDIALLLPRGLAESVDFLTLSRLNSVIESGLKRKIDLINLRKVSTVFQKEIISADRRVYCGDANASDEFEMLTLSYYQKLNEERKEQYKDISSF